MYHPTVERMLTRFPKLGKYHNGPWAGQTDMFSFVSQNGSSLIQSPTGSGKTAVQYAIAQTAAAECTEEGGTWLIVPNKTIAEQTAMEFPDLNVAYGQNEHVCPWAAEDFEEEPKKPVLIVDLPVLEADKDMLHADDIPHVMHRRCPHYVDQTTGETKVPGALPCPYYDQKFKALKAGGVVLCTMSFYLFNVLFGGRKAKPQALVIDEVHRFAEVIRGSLSYDITDWHLEQSIRLLGRLGDEVKGEIEVLNQFLETMVRIATARKRAPDEETLLTDEEIRQLIEILENINAQVLLSKIERAVTEGVINPVVERVTLKKLETLVRDIRHYVHSFAYALAEHDIEGNVVRNALNYSCAFFRKEKGDRDRWLHKLVIRCHYVAPLIAKRLLAPFTVSFSATIGNTETFGYESGIWHPFHSAESNFPAKNTRLYMCADTPNLAVNKRNKRDLPQSLRKIARACVRFSQNGHRSLVIVISNEEREKFLMMAREEGLDAISYGKQLTAKEAATAFREGHATTLVGTEANYSEGVDLPGGMAPVTFYLRPGYPNPHDAAAQFEERRFGGMRWALWNDRVMRKALQARGRNVRSTSDKGVTFFISQQFRRVLYAALPKWLEPAYRREMTFEQAVHDAEQLLADAT